MHGPVYATPEDLAAYLELDQAPDNADRLLAKASRLVDGLLIGARYDTDDQGQPTDPDVADALLDATVAQAAYWHQGHGDPEGAAATWGSVSIGSVRLADRRGATTQAGAVEVNGVQVAPGTVSALRLAGALPVHPIVR